MKITKKVLMNAVIEYVQEVNGAYSFYQDQTCAFGQNPERVLSDVTRQLHKAGVYNFVIVDSGENSEYVYVTLQFDESMSK